MLDESLLAVAGATAGMRAGGTLVVNTAMAPGEIDAPSGVRVVTADVTSAARAVDLIVGGKPMVSTAILGAIAKATGLVTLDSLNVAISHAFKGSAAKKNYDAAVIAYDCVRL